MSSSQQANDTAAAEVWAAHRPKMFAVAYRMLGSVTEAEDAVQEAYLRLTQTNVAELRNPEAWLTRAVSRICLTRLGAASSRRENYIGPWLPEPLLVASDPDPVVMAESVSAAFLVVLEALSPTERLAFLLHDVFDYEYGDLAEVLDRSEAACRQLVSRARRAVQARRPRFSTDDDSRRRVADAFIRACQRGEIDRLLELLAPDVVVRTDGGGKAKAARRPVVGPDRAARLIVGVLRKRGDVPVRLPYVNGLPGLGLHDAAGHLYWIISLTVDEDGFVATVDLVTNPDKLTHAHHRPLQSDSTSSGER